MNTGSKHATLDAQALRNLNAYWRAANYLAVGQIYLRANPLLREPLKLEHVKHTLVGHWGTTPGQNFIYAHLNRVIREYDLDMIYLSGPGHVAVSSVAGSRHAGSPSPCSAACCRARCRVHSSGRYVASNG